MQRDGENRLFRTATLGCLIALLCFYLVTILSLAVYVDWEILLSTLVSREIFFAIKLSLLTAICHPGQLCSIKNGILGEKRGGYPLGHPHRGIPRCLWLGAAHLL
ncbi:MAG: hypothetical protein ACE5NJ_07650 [Thermodesulfobacteriota bacterium]